MQGFALEFSAKPVNSPVDHEAPIHEAPAPVDRVSGPTLQLGGGRLKWRWCSSHHQLWQPAEVSSCKYTSAAGRLQQHGLNPAPVLSCSHWAVWALDAIQPCDICVQNCLHLSPKPKQHSTENHWPLWEGRGREVPNCCLGLEGWMVQAPNRILQN